MHEGHRQRMLERLERADALQDHELLEILLFNAVPRKNTNPLAHELLSVFGSLEGVFGASFEELLEVNGIGRETAAYLKCIAALLPRMAKSSEEPPKLFNVRTFSAFLTKRMSGLDAEVIEPYCVDVNERIRASRRIALGTASTARAEPEEVSRFLAAHRPAGLVAAHNHPSAPAHPSPDDDRFTAQLEMLCAMNNVRLYDHIIVGQGGVYSYFLVGRLEEIRKNFNLSALFGGKICR